MRTRDFVALFICLSIVISVYVYIERDDMFGMKTKMLSYQSAPIVVPGDFESGKRSLWLLYNANFVMKDSAWAMESVSMAARGWCEENNRQLVEGTFDLGYAAKRDSVVFVRFLLKN